MKIRVTRKEIENNYKNIICIGYCNIQYLLYYENARYNTSGVYGWNADIYEINNNTCIVTGYRPFGNIRIDYDIQQKYEEKARKIVLDYSISWEKQKKKLEKLLQKFVNQALKIEE